MEAGEVDLCFNQEILHNVRVSHPAGSTEPSSASQTSTTSPAPAGAGALHHAGGLLREGPLLPQGESVARESGDKLAAPRSSRGAADGRLHAAAAAQTTAAAGAVEQPSRYRFRASPSCSHWKFGSAEAVKLGSGEQLRGGGSGQQQAAELRSPEASSVNECRLPRFSLGISQSSFVSSFARAVAELPPPAVLQMAGGTEGSRAESDGSLFGPRGCCGSPACASPGPHVQTATASAATAAAAADAAAAPPSHTPHTSPSHRAGSLVTRTSPHISHVLPSLRSTVSPRATVTDDQVHPSGALGDSGAAMGTPAGSTSSPDGSGRSGSPESSSPPRDCPGDGRREDSPHCGSGRSGSPESSSLPRDRPGDGRREDPPHSCNAVGADTGALGRCGSSAGAGTMATCATWGRDMGGHTNTSSLSAEDGALHAERGAPSVLHLEEPSAPEVAACRTTAAPQYGTWRMQSHTLPHEVVLEPPPTVGTVVAPHSSTLCPSLQPGRGVAGNSTSTVILPTQAHRGTSHDVGALYATRGALVASAAECGATRPPPATSSPTPTTT